MSKGSQAGIQASMPQGMPVPTSGTSVGAPGVSVGNIGAPTAASIGQQLMQQFASQGTPAKNQAMLQSIVQGLQGMQKANIAAQPTPLVNPQSGAQISPAQAQVLKMMQPYFSVPQAGLGGK